MRTGVRLGVDVGTARIGVARSDLHGMLATPVETIPRGTGDLQRLGEIARELEVVEIIVGLPLALSGRQTASTDDALGFARAIAAERLAPVRTVDERLSTVSAHAALRASGRSSRSFRPVVDQVAAVIILQHALDSERSAERPPGALIDPDEGA
jgi:putative holliday junction resolvase